MSDIDFDELDRAVNDLMKDVGTKKDESLSSDANVKTLDLPEMPTETAAPESEPEPEPAPELEPPIEKKDEAIHDIESHDSMPVTPPVATPTSVVAPQRPRGRFMDIVSPSANMRGAPAPSRQGKTIDPVTPLTSSSNVVDTFAATPKEEEILPHIDDTPATPEWSDSIDQPTKKQEDAFAHTLDSLQPGDEKPMDSPFLPDAKVEKRPLGVPMSASEAFMPSPQHESSDMSEPVQTTNDEELMNTLDESAPVDQSSEEAAQVAPEVALPAELSQDVMQVESGETNGDSKGNNHSDDTHEQESVQYNQQPAIPSKPEVVTAPLTAVAIPQQYQEKPAATEEENTPIYTTEEYPSGVAHPVKHKSSWLWVLWIVVLLALGAGGGAAAYLFFVQ
ncbi:MAG: hypothetical protein WAQ22_04005 [Candidatus Saccharimonas sp.]